MLLLLPTDYGRVDWLSFVASSLFQNDPSDQFMLRNGIDLVED